MNSEKVKAMPIGTRADMLDNINKLVQCHTKQIDLLYQMKLALMHEWEKDSPLKPGSENHTALIEMMREMQGGVWKRPETAFLRAQRAYYTAVEQGQSEMSVVGYGTLPVIYVRHLLDYLRAGVVNKAEIPSVLDATLKTWERNHQKVMRGLK